jgi:hypothetical protein
MVVAETLAGIALVNSAVKGIKSAIGTAKDISSIADDIDKLFEGAQQVKSKKTPNPLLAKWDAALKSKLGDNADKFSIGNVAKDVIERKMAEESLEQMAMLVNKRFGWGTWDTILLERQELIEKAKSAAKKRKEEQQEKWDTAFEWVKNICILLIATGAIIIMVLWAKSK